jgi:Ca-activated chloride channel family protein
MNTITVADPDVLWWLIVPAIVIVLWIWRMVRRVTDLRRLRARRVVPTRERFAGIGELAFWLAAIVSSAACLLAVARPMAPTTLPTRAGLDVIVLQDASASMRVTDVAATPDAAGLVSGRADRWQRSMRFLRELGDALSWTNDRLALVAFAHVATPQIRLTRDPNTLFFFLDHLHAKPPFRLEDDTTWDTNLEEAITWGLRLVDKDDELHGRTTNGRVFVLLSDGEAWSGEVAKAVARLSGRGIPIYVIGVGSLGGAPMPTVRTAAGELRESPGASRLDRASLQRIAIAGQGDYFELDRDDDRTIANGIIAAGRRLAPAVGMQDVSQELYWWFLLAAAIVAAAGLPFIRHTAELGILLAGGTIAAIILAPSLW